MTIPTAISEETIFSGKTIEIVHQKQQIGDKQAIREFARRSPGTRLIIIKSDKVLLTKEYRMELQAWDYRLPGGKVFDSLSEYNKFLRSGQDILVQATTAAKKEAKEECGLIVSDISYFSTSICGNTMVWDLYYFVVSGFEESTQELELGENVETNWFTFAEAKELSLTGKMSEDRSAATLLRFLHQI